MKNDLTKIPTSHFMYRKRRAEQKEVQKRNQKAIEYLDQVVPKLNIYKNVKS